MGSVRLVAALTFSLVLLRAGSAFADLPGPRMSCSGVAAGHGCDTCVRDYGDPDAGAFDGCTSAALAKGFVSACLERQFKVETTYFCPAGAVKPTEVVTPAAGARGCGGCTLTDATACRSSTLPALALLALAALRRRRRSSI